MLATLASMACELAGQRRQLDGILRPVDRRRRRVGEEIEGHEQRAGQQIPALQLRPRPVRHQVVDQVPADGREVRAGSQVDHADPEPLRVQTDGHRRRELEGLRIDRALTTATTSPIGMPRNSTGAPGTSPRTDWLKTST